MEKTVKSLVGCFCIMAAVPAANAAASNGTWIGGGATTDWTDTGNWLYGNYPVSTSHAIFFKPANQTAPATLTATQAVSCMYVQLDARTNADGNEYLPDTIPVTLKSPMSLTLYPSTTVALNIAAGRRLVIDGATVKECGGIIEKGELVLRNGALLSATNRTQECAFKQSGAGILVDGASASLYALRTVYDDTLRFAVRNGGFFKFDQLYGTVGVPAEWQASVIDGTVWAPANAPVYNAGLVPSRSGSLVVRRNAAEAFKPDLAYGAAVRWGGDVYVTNHVDAALVVTNVSTFYGGGRLFANAFTFTQGHATQTVDLAEINLGKTINFSGWGHTTCYDFVGGTRFGGFGNWRSSEQPNDLYWMIFRGDNVFDTLDCFDHETKRTFWMKRIFLQLRSSLAYVGGGSVTNLVEEFPTRLAGLAVGDGTTVVFASLPSSAKALNVQSLSLAANSRVVLPSITKFFCVHGRADVDSSARISIPVPATLDTTLYPVYSSLDDTVPTAALEIGELPEGWALKTVAGTAYLSNGAQSYEQWDVWTGKKSGLWSDGDNWILTPPTTSDRMARFHGETNTTVTNDVDNVEVIRLRTETKSAPFVLTGKPIALTATGTSDSSTIYHQNKFPFIVETPLTSEAEAFNVTLTTTATAPVVLRGGVSAPSAKFSIAGDVVADGPVSAAQFGFLSTTLASTFTVRRGATAAFSTQSDAIANKGTIWIEPGATMSVTGALRWATYKNEHRIDGLLDVRGSIGGAVSQGYFGTGVVQVASSATAPGECAAIRIGEGVTLKPASWGSVPIDVVSSATLAADGDWTYDVAGGLGVSGLGATLSFDTCGHDIAIAVPLVGRDFDMVKTGSGSLVLATTNTLAGRVTVESGSLEWHGDQSFARLDTKPGSVLLFGSKDGKVSCISAGDSVDLTGVTIAAADVEAKGLARCAPCAILKVPEFCEIRGVPSVTRNYKVTVVPTSDGGQELVAKVRNGMVLVVR